MRTVMIMRRVSTLLIVVPILIMTLAVIGIIIVKVYEMKRDQARIARGEEPLSKDPPIIEVIDWTRKKS